jgi:hypothetical protein
VEGKRFDDLSRAIAGMSSRRRVLRGLVGGAIAGLAGGIGLRGADAAAVKRPGGAICRKPGDCESNVCLPDGTGRSRCGCGSNNSYCNGACCQTYCDPQYGCMDNIISPQCYEQCENNICFGMNNYYNYSFNESYPCEAFCAYQCSIT